MSIHMPEFTRPVQFRRRALLAALGLVLASGYAGISHAQEKWPTKPVRLVVPFSPGGSTDAVGRLLATELGKALGQSFVVENKAGANGTIGSDNVARSAADGYTLLLSGIGSNAINYSLYPKMSYDDSAFRHIALLATGPGVLAVNQSFPAKTATEFFDLVKKNPGTYAYATAGAGSSGHLSMELLKQTKDLDILHVPYKGNGPAITDVIGGQVPVIILNNDTALPQVQAGKLHALAVTSAQRNPAYPDVPTLAESGVPGFDVASWFGLSAPKGTPDEIVERLSAAVKVALEAPKFKEYLESTGFVRDYRDPQGFSGFVDSQINQWRDVVKQADIRME